MTIRRIPFLTALLLTALGGTMQAQRDFSDVKIEARHVAGSVYMITGAGGNIGASVGEDGVLMIDSQFLPLAERIRAAVREIRSGDLVFLLNTHHHGDHTGGNPFFGKEANIVAHQNVRGRLEEQRSRGLPQEALPKITFDASMTLHFNSETIRVTHLPTGHTDGDSAIHFVESNVLHMGDQFFNARFPYIDLSSGGDVEGYIANVRRMLDSIPDDIQIIPGHGELAGKKDLEAFHAMLTKCAGIVRTAIAEGKSIEDIKAAGLPKEYEDWGGGFINTSRWIDILHNSLSKE